MFDLFVWRRHGAFGRILVLFLLLPVVVAAVVIIVIIIVVARAVVIVIVVAVVLIVVKSPLLIVVLPAVVVLALLVVVLSVIIAWTLLLLAVAALLLRSLVVGGGLFVVESFQKSSLHVVKIVRIGVVGYVFRLFLAGFGTDFLVDFGFELEAAFQTAATTGNVLRIERKSLLFRHFHIDAVEAVEEFRAAERAAACADAAENGRFVANTDLPQFDADFQKAGQVA